MKAKRMKKYVMILVAFLIIFSFNTVNANVNQKLIEEAQKLEKWDNLPEEEKINQGLTYNSVSLNESVKRSTYNKLLGGNVSALESKYSLLDKLPNGSITVRNQGYTELCWAFSYASVLDTTAAMKNNKTYRFSAIHSDYVATKYFNKVKGGPGNFEIALATSVSGEGPVYEADMPFESYYKETGNEYEYEISYDGVEEEKLQARAKINETYSFPAISKTYTKTAVKYLDSMDNEYSNEALTSIRTQIKQHIKNCGALLASTYMGTDEKLFSKGENGSFAYCNKNTSYKQNHAVTIIGWDDTYSKENFADSEYKPLSDGAYIVLNSYGESLLPYFYVSYEDSLIENYVRGIKNIQVYSEKEKNYDNLYQYDELGENFSYYEIKDDFSAFEGEVYTANVFTRKDITKKEYVEEVGIYVPITEGIEIYVDAKNGDMKDYGEAVAVYTGNNALEPGYHAIKLGTPIEVTGEEFAIIVKYINAEGAKYSLECNLNDTGLTTNSNIWSKAKAETGQSFISVNGNDWNDINEHGLYWSSVENNLVKKTYKNTNACIKAFTKVEEPKIDVKSVSLNENSITIEEGKTYTLIATVLPENATNQKVNWSSEDESIATVTGGVITGKKAGKTTVTVTTVDKELTASCEVTVTAKTISVDSVELDKRSITIEEGKTEVLIATVLPENATNKKINWSSTDESIATVTGGVITGKKAGKTTVIVTTVDKELTASCEVTVKNAETPHISVESVNLNETSITIEEGKTKTLIATVMPENATNKNIDWSSTDESVATVKNGVIEGKGPGKTTVTVKTQDKGLTASCEVIVTAKVISVESVELNKTSTTIKEGTTETLRATVLPENATNQKVNWSSADESIVTVKDGVIEGKRPGKTTVTVTTVDKELKASCEVTVEAKTIPVDSIKLNKTSTTIKEGTTETLRATVLPENATNQNVNWSSADESIATVQNGVIEGKKAGKTLITVTTDDGEKMAACEVTVTAKTIPVDSVELDKRSITVEIGKTEALIATVKPDNATNKKINWTSADESIVTVQNGIIEGKKVGKAIVTVTTEDGEKTASCEITVKNAETPHVSVESVNLNKNSITIEKGKTEILIATVKPDNATNKKINWLSTDESTVTVQNGVIEGKKAGKAIITVITEEGEKKAICEVTVEEGKPEIILVNSVKLNKTETTIEEGTTETLIATVLPENATNQKVNWKSEDESIATVTGGVITGKKAGKTVITVTTEEGEKTASCEVMVKEKETEKISVESISLNTNNETIENGTILNLMLTFNPSNATNKNVKWESSNEKVAVVNGNGIVKAVGEGKTTIKVTSEDGNKEATCEITVTKKVNKDDDIYSTKDDNTVSDRNLPNTGLKVIIMVLIGLSSFTIIKFIKYRNLKDIK